MKSFVTAATLAAALAAPALAQIPGGARAIETLRRADANHDDVVTRAEFTAFRQTQFSRLDRNRDGVISSRDAPRLGGRRGPNGLTFPDLIARFDADRDGRVTRREFVQGPTPGFSQVDVNGDDVASRSEFDAARRRMREGL